MNESLASVRVLELSDFEQLSPSWAAGEPFPLIRCPAVDRYLMTCSNAGFGFPAVRTTHREGVVISVGEAGGAAGRLLAIASGRPWHHVDLDELTSAIDQHSEAPIALVGLADELARFGDWPGVRAPRLGVLATYDKATLICLIYRSLTVGAFPRSNDFTVMHPVYPEAHNADAVEHSELGPLRTNNFRALKIWAFGAECSMHLPDAMICGRPDHFDQPLPINVIGRQAPSCLRGEGCFRQDLMPQQRLSPAQIDAQVVFAESCGSIALGNNVLAPEMNAALAFMQTHSVAVIGALATHNSNPAFRREFERALDQNNMLGDVLHAVNRRARSGGGTMSIFGLLGDPTITLATPSPNRTASGACSLKKSETDWVERQAFKRLEGVYAIIERLRRLRWLNLPFDDSILSPLSKRIERDLKEDNWELYRQTGDEVSRQIASIQAELMNSIVRQVDSTQWSFIEDQLFAFREVSSEPRTCPACERPRAVLLEFQHRVDEGFLVRTVQCRRCHDVWWSTGDASSLTMAGDWEFNARKGTRPTIRREITNHSSGEMVGAIGFAVTSGVMWGFPPLAATTQSCHVAPRSSINTAWNFDVSGSDLILKDYEIPLLTLFNGVYSAMSTRLILLA